MKKWSAVILGVILILTSFTYVSAAEPLPGASAAGAPSTEAATSSASSAGATIFSAPASASSAGVAGVSTSGVQSAGEQHIVSYMDTDGSTVLFTRTLQEGESVDLSSPVSVQDPEEFAGWNTERGAQEALPSLEVGNRDVTLYPVLKKAYDYVFTFDTAGGTPLGAAYVRTGEKLQKPEDPVKEGYRFAGWKDEAGQLFDFDQAPSAGGKLTASWVPADTKVRVITYQENLDGSFAVLDSKEVRVETGAQVKAADYVQGKTGFSFDPNRSDKEVPAAPDGTSVLKLYYTRKVYTLVFRLQGDRKRTSGPDQYTPELRVGEQTYAETEEYSFQAKYGKGIKLDWPTVSNVYGKPNRWLATDYSGVIRGYFNGWKAGENVFRFEDVLDDDLIQLADANGKITFNGSWAKQTVSMQYNLFLQGAENPNDYRLEKKWIYSVKPGQNEKVYVPSVPGFVYNQRKSIFENPKTFTSGWFWDRYEYKYFEKNNLYFDRITYPLTFVSEGSTIKTENVPQGKKLAVYENTTPTTAQMPENAVFRGWYTADGQRFSFSQIGDRMPQHEVTLFAKYETAPRGTHRVDFDLDGGSSAAIPSQTVTEGSSAKKPESDPEKAGFRFLGWYRNQKPYRFTELVKQDLTLTAKWKKLGSFRLTYDANGAEGEVQESRNFQEGTQVRVAGADALSRPGYQFLNWSTRKEDQADAAHYLPGKTLSMAGDTTLYALWKRNPVSPSNGSQAGNGNRPGSEAGDSNTGGNSQAGTGESASTPSGSGVSMSNTASGSRFTTVAPTIAGVQAEAGAQGSVAGRGQVLGATRSKKVAKERMAKRMAGSKGGRGGDRAVAASGKLPRHSTAGRAAKNTGTKNARKAFTGESGNTTLRWMLVLLCAGVALLLLNERKCRTIILAFRKRKKVQKNEN